MYEAHNTYNLQHITWLHHQIFRGPKENEWISFLGPRWSIPVSCALWTHGSRFFDVFCEFSFPSGFCPQRDASIHYRNNWLMINPICLTLQHHELSTSTGIHHNTTIIVNQSLNHPHPPNLIYHATLQSVQARNSVWHGSYMAPCDIATRFHRCSNVERACPEKQTKPLIWWRNTKERLKILMNKNELTLDWIGWQCLT